MNYKELKEKLSKVDLISAYPFINNYGISTKTNKETGNDELVVEFGVSVKIKLEDINSNYILPTSLSAYGIDIKTKVSQAAQASINFTNDDDEVIKYYEKVGVNLEQSHDYMQLQSIYNDHQDYLAANSVLSADINYSFHILNPSVNPIKRNRQKARPLSGGCSSIYYGGTDATLGLFVRDKQDKKIVALSNSHVYSRSLLLGEEALGFGAENNMLSLSGRQPGSLSNNPYGNADPAVDHIGTPKRTSRLSLQNNNKVDASILELSSYNLLDDSSMNVIWFKQKGPYEFATTDEMDSLMDPASINYQSPIFRSGRTLGPLGYPGHVLDTQSNTPRSSTSIISLNQTLTTNNGFNTLFHGISSLYFKSEMFYPSKTQASLLFTTADETSAFIVGYKNYYNNPTISLFYTSNNDYSPELVINDPAGIQNISIFSNYFGSVYTNKLGKIYHGPKYPSSQARTSYSLYLASGQLSITVPYSDWSPLSSSNGNIFSKPVRKSAFDIDGSFVLTEDNELWTMGANICITANGADGTRYGNDGNPMNSGFQTYNYVCGLPYEVNNLTEGKQSLEKLTRIPGEWIDFGFHNSNDDSFLYAISASGDLFAAYYSLDKISYVNRRSMSPMLFNGFIQTPPQVIASHPTGNWSLSSSPDLSHTKIPLIVDGQNIKIKKIFTNSNKDGDLGKNVYAPLLFQTEDDKILTFSKPTAITHQSYASGYLQYNGEDIVITEKTETINGRGTSESTMTILSGNNIYGLGADSNSVNFNADTWIDTLGNGTDYDIQTLLPYTTYFDLKKWDNMLPNSVTNACGSLVYRASLGGSDTNSVNFAGEYGGTIIYTDGIGLSGIGYAPSGIFGTYGGLYRDEIIMTSVNRSINVTGFTSSGYLRFIENLDFKMKNNNGAPAAGGDSGSALFACLSSTMPALSTFKLVGLLYASNAPTNTSSGFGVRIDNIQNELDIEPWDGII